LPEALATFEAAIHQFIRIAAEIVRIIVVGATRRRDARGTATTSKLSAVTKPQKSICNR